MQPSAEVVIVGGGVVGASIAYHLARLGLTDVLVLEREDTLGEGSTGRAAGGFRHQFSTEINIRLSVESLARLDHLEEETGSPVRLHRHGYLLLATTPAGLAQLEANLALQRSLGVPVERWSAADAARRVPALNVDDVLGATFCHLDGYGDPHELCQAFAAGARRHGVKFVTGTPVTGVRVQGNRIRAVITPRGEVAAGAVVCAANAWAPQVAAMAGVDLPIRPYRRTLWVTGPVPDIGHPLPMVVDTHNGFHFRSEGQMVLFAMADPGDPPGYVLTPHDAWLPHVLEAMVHRVPPLAEAGIGRAWAGVYGVTPDAHALVGRLPEPENFYVAAGFSGHGVMHSPATGRIVADLVVHGRTAGYDVSALSPTRFAAGATFGEQMVL